MRRDRPSRPFTLIPLLAIRVRNSGVQEPPVERRGHVLRELRHSDKGHYSERWLNPASAPPRTRPRLARRPGRDESSPADGDPAPGGPAPRTWRAGPGERRGWPRLTPDG